MGARGSSTDSGRPVGAIPTPLAPRLRLTAAGASLGLAVAIAVSLSLAGSSTPIVVAWLGVVGLLGGLIQRPGYLFPSALAVIGLAAVTEVLEGDVPTRLAALLGGALLACGELGYWSYELRVNMRHSAISVTRRAGVIAGLALLGTALSGLGFELLGRLTAT